MYRLFMYVVTRAPWLMGKESWKEPMFHDGMRAYWKLEGSKTTLLLVDHTEE